MKALQKSQNVDIYSHKGIQLIVENQWHKWKLFNWWAILFPMLLQVLIFSFNSIIVQQQVDKFNFSFILIL